jgi:hypothetical protein
MSCEAEIRILVGAIDEFGMMRESPTNCAGAVLIRKLLFQEDTMVSSPHTILKPDSCSMRRGCPAKSCLKLPAAGDFHKRTKILQEDRHDMKRIQTHSVHLVGSGSWRQSRSGNKHLHRPAMPQMALSADELSTTCHTFAMQRVAAKKLLTACGDRMSFHIA